MNIEIASSIIGALTGGFLTSIVSWVGLFRRLNSISTDVKVLQIQVSHMQSDSDTMRWSQVGPTIAQLGGKGD